MLYIHSVYTFIPKLATTGVHLFIMDGCPDLRSYIIPGIEVVSAIINSKVGSHI